MPTLANDGLTVDYLADGAGHMGPLTHIAAANAEFQAFLAG